MNCEEVKVQLSAYIDGETSEEDTNVIDEHIAVCNDCAQTEQALRRSSQMLKSWENVPAPEGFCEAVLARAETMSRRSRRGIFNMVRPFAGPGAFVRVAICGAVVLLLSVAVVSLVKLPLKKAPLVEPSTVQSEIALQESDDNIQIPEDSFTYTTIAEIRGAQTW